MSNKKIPFNYFMFSASLDWIITNEWTPYIVVDTKNENIVVPSGFENEHGQMVLNVSANAVSNFILEKEALSFSSRFNGQVMDLFIPIESIICVFPNEMPLPIEMPPFDLINKCSAFLEIEDTTKSNNNVNPDSSTTFEFL